MDYRKLHPFLDQVEYGYLKKFAREYLDLTPGEIEEATSKNNVLDQKISLIQQWLQRVGYVGNFDYLMELHKKFTSKGTSNAGDSAQPSDHPSSDTTLSNYSDPVAPQQLLSAGPSNPYNPHPDNKEERELLQQVHSPCTSAEGLSHTVTENEIECNESNSEEEGSNHFDNQMPSGHEERTPEGTVRQNGQYEDTTAAVRGLLNKPVLSKTFASAAACLKDEYFDIVCMPPSSIEVDDCSKQDASRLSRHEEYYSILDKEFKGYILIFNNTFKDAEDERKGSQFDVKNLKCLWREIGGCKVLEKPNLNAEDMKSEIARFVTSKKRKTCGFVAFFIMSHGNSEYYHQDGATRIGEGYILGNDRQKVMMSDISEMMDNDYPGTTLQGIPKLIFFQACRGERLDGGVHNECNPTAVATDKSSSKKMGMARKMPEKSDTLTSYATQKGYQAVRDTSSGTWFVNAIVNVFRKHAKLEHVGDLMTKVNEAIRQKHAHLESGERCMEMSETTSTLCRKLMLFPGQENEGF